MATANLESVVGADNELALLGFIPLVFTSCIYIERIMTSLKVLLCLGSFLAVSIGGLEPRISSPVYPAQLKTDSPQSGVGIQGVQQTKATGFVRHVDAAGFPSAFHGEIIAGPESGAESCYLIYTRVPPGVHGPGLHTHSVDQFYFILSGTMNVQLGADKFVVGPETLVFIPAGTPHMNWNSGSVSEAHLEIIVPPAPLESLAKPASPRKVPNAKEYIRPVKRELFQGQGFAAQWLARQSTGSEHAAVREDELQPGSGSAGLHFSAFDQFYFVTDGKMNVDLGFRHLRAGENTLVLIPAGMVHRIWNDGPAVEKHITILVPEREPLEKFEYPAEIHREQVR
jgi:mannose-6-phosphate isomerase-like protein (cupin superfamily)